MRFSLTLSLYVVRNLLLNLLYILVIFAFLGFLIEFLELIRETQDKKVLIEHMLKMALYKTPFLTFSFFPFIFLFGAIMTFTKLNNSSELIAAKCAGLSIWSLCAPIAIAVVILSWLILLIFQPISAILLDNNRILGAKYLGYVSKRVSLQTGGIWLYDQGVNNEDDKIIYIKHIDKGHLLSKISIHYACDSQEYTTSYTANSGLIKDKNLVLTDVLKYEPGKTAIHYQQLSIPTHLSPDQIQQSIPYPDISSFWDLKNFIAQMKKSGFSTLRHELYYKSMMASPLLYLSLVLIALSCSINLPRNGRLGVVFITAGLVGILIFFVDKIINVMALTGSLPINVAAIFPSLIYLLLSLAVLIHCEEG